MRLLRRNRTVISITSNISGSVADDSRPSSPISSKTWREPSRASTLIQRNITRTSIIENNDADLKDLVKNYSTDESSISSIKTQEFTIETVEIWSLSQIFGYIKSSPFLYCSENELVTLLRTLITMNCPDITESYLETCIGQIIKEFVKNECIMKINTQDYFINEDANIIGVLPQFTSCYNYSSTHSHDKRSRVFCYALEPIPIEEKLPELPLKPRLRYPVQDWISYWDVHVTGKLSFDDELQSIIFEMISVINRNYNNLKIFIKSTKDSFSQANLNFDNTYYTIQEFYDRLISSYEEILKLKLQKVVEPLENFLQSEGQYITSNYWEPVIDWLISSRRLFIQEWKNNCELSAFIQIESVKKSSKIYDWFINEKSRQSSQTAEYFQYMSKEFVELQNVGERLIKHWKKGSNEDQLRGAEQLYKTIRNTLTLSNSLKGNGDAIAYLERMNFGHCESFFKNQTLQYQDSISFYSWIITKSSKNHHKDVFIFLFNYWVIICEFHEPYSKFNVLVNPIPSYFLYSNLEKVLEDDIYQAEIHNLSDHFPIQWVISLCFTVEKNRIANQSLFVMLNDFHSKSFDKIFQSKYSFGYIGKILNFHDEFYDKRINDRLYKSQAIECVNEINVGDYPYFNGKDEFGNNPFFNNNASSIISISNINNEDEKYYVAIKKNELIMVSEKDFLKKTPDNLFEGIKVFQSSNEIDLIKKWNFNFVSILSDHKIFTFNVKKLINAYKKGQYYNFGNYQSLFPNLTLQPRITIQGFDILTDYEFNEDSSLQHMIIAGVINGEIEFQIVSLTTDIVKNKSFSNIASGKVHRFKPLKSKKIKWQSLKVLLIAHKSSQVYFWQKSFPMIFGHNLPSPGYGDQADLQRQSTVTTVPRKFISYHPADFQALAEAFNLIPQPSVYLSNQIQFSKTVSENNDEDYVCPISIFPLSSEENLLVFPEFAICLDNQGLASRKRKLLSFGIIAQSASFVNENLIVFGKTSIEVYKINDKMKLTVGSLIQVLHGRSLRVLNDKETIFISGLSRGRLMDYHVFKLESVV